MTDREKILDKLKKLKAHAESAAKIGSEAEAQAFAEMVQSMIARHNIGQAELSDLERAEEDKVNPVVEVTTPYHKGVVRKRRVAWLENLASCVAHAHYCQVLITPVSSRVWFVGRKAQAEMCVEVYMRLAATAERLSAAAAMQFYREDRGQRGEGKVDRGYGSARGFRPAFLEGFVSRLATRYYKRMDDFAQEAARQAGAIVLFKTEAQRIEEYIKDMFKNRKNTPDIPEPKRAEWHAEGRRRGKEAADKLDIGAGPKRIEQLPE